MSLPCPDPEFTYDFEMGWWRWCSRCRRPAWEHEQSDPLADIRKVIAVARGEGKPWDYPPAMKPLSTDGQ